MSGKRRFFSLLLNKIRPLTILCIVVMMVLLIIFHHHNKKSVETRRFSMDWIKGLERPQSFEGFKSELFTNEIDAVINPWLARLKICTDRLKMTLNIWDSSRKSPEASKVLSTSNDYSGLMNESLSNDDDCENGTRWAVITTIAETMTKPMEVVLSQGWCLVAVGDVKSPANFKVTVRTSRFIFLTVQDQMRLPFKIVSKTPKNSFMRKNIGYLFAMSKGAKVILDIDDDNEPIPVKIGDDKKIFIPVETELKIYQRPLLYKESYLTVSADSPVWNPYVHFNLTQAWPRGFPWDFIPGLVPTEIGRTKDQFCKPVIQQYIADIEPDVDAAFRLTEKLPIYFEPDTDRQTIVLPRNVFAPYNAQATVHLKEAFWSMMLPISVDGRVSDIWRSYITQSLLHLQPEACVMFTSPAVKHVRNPHNYKRDFLKELPLYGKASRFVEIVRNFPQNPETFGEAFLNVYQLLFKSDLLQEDDVDYANLWLEDLKSLGVSLPKMIPKTVFTRQTKLCLSFVESRENSFLKEFETKISPFFKNVVRFSNGRKSNDVKQVGISEICNSENSGFSRGNCLKNCISMAGNHSTFFTSPDAFVNYSMLIQSDFSGDKFWLPRATEREERFVEDPVVLEELFRNISSKINVNFPINFKKNERLHRKYAENLVYIPGKMLRNISLVLGVVENLNPNLSSGTVTSLVVSLVSEMEGNEIMSPQIQTKEKKISGENSQRIALKNDIFVRPLLLESPALRSLWRDAMAEQFMGLVQENVKFE